MKKTPSSAPSDRVDIEIDGRKLSLSNLDKVLWPRAGLTKGWLIEYYTRVAPAILPHIRGHPMTLHRFPNGVDGMHWFETRAPAHPPWVETVTLEMARSGKVFDVCVLNDLPSLVWAAQMATVELHPYLGTVGALDRPTAVVFDLDPGSPATVVDCCRVATRLRAVLGDLGLDAWAKTSGWSGLHVYVPVNGSASFDEAKAFARAVARRLEHDDPQSVTSQMAREKRTGKVFVDWSQNDRGKSTVAPWSLRGWEVPTVSTPVAWGEVEAVASAGDPGRLTFLADEALRRLGAGDLFTPVTTVAQQLPAGAGAGGP